MLDKYLDQWDLASDGDAIITRSSWLLPVVWRGRPAMLKLALEQEEARGHAVMAWWGGKGAARVYARDEKAILMERAIGTKTLTDMARHGQDDAACAILCSTAALLHAPRKTVLEGLCPLENWFLPLERAAATHGGVLSRSARMARMLLAEPREVSVLHGDLHHGNVLDFRERGWLAIDPKGLVGERAFDFANIFINPDLADPHYPVAVDPERFMRRLEIVATVARLERARLLQWILAWAGLSAAWCMEDKRSAYISLTIAEIAAAVLY